MTQQISVEHLSLNRVNDPVGSPRSYHETLLILGNAYGILPYQEPLSHAMANRGWESWWFAFSGQEGTSGGYCSDSCVRDIDITIKFLKEHRPNQPLSILAHCAGGLMALEYLRQEPERQDAIRKMIYYGLLFQPARRRADVLPKLYERGVNVTLTDEDWNYTPIPSLSSLRIPILFCHAKDRINLRRATEVEMAEAVARTPNAEMAWFDKGYDVDLGTLSCFVERYSNWLKPRRD